MVRQLSRDPVARAYAAVCSALLLMALLAGCDGGPSPETPPGIRFTPVADTRVEDQQPSRNFGSSGKLGVDAAQEVRSFLKFTVSGITQPISAVTLRLHVQDTDTGGSHDGGTWALMSNTRWSETAVTWKNQPSLDGATVGALGSVHHDSWAELDLTGVVTGNGTYSIGAVSADKDGADYDSRESEFPPQLVIRTGRAPAPRPATGDPVLVGAGDIAGSGKADSATAAIIKRMPGATVFTTGDNAYPDGTLANYRKYYAPTWGAFRSRTRPAPGNHDYHVSAEGYFDYFGALAGPRRRGYYSYDLGSWHVVSLNSQISMAAGSPQERWLRDDLAASSSRCTVAYWHEPLFTSSAKHRSDEAALPLWEALYDAGAELVINGHDHQYERFAPMTPTGEADDATGIRQFVVGTGGAELYGLGDIEPNSEARAKTAGVLELILHDDGYHWRFIPVAGGTFSDTGSGTCH